MFTVIFERILGVVLRPHLTMYYRRYSLGVSAPIKVGSEFWWDVLCGCSRCSATAWRNRHVTARVVASVSSAVVQRSDLHTRSATEKPSTPWLRTIFPRSLTITRSAYGHPRGYRELQCLAGQDRRQHFESPRPRHYLFEKGNRDFLKRYSGPANLCLCTPRGSSRRHEELQWHLCDGAVRNEGGLKVTQ
jgi:hypothetical protein